MRSLTRVIACKTRRRNRPEYNHGKDQDQAVQDLPHHIMQGKSGDSQVIFICLPQIGFELGSPPP